MIKDTLEKIMSWLSDNANRIATYSMNAPADETDIDTIGRLTKYLPPDFKELYRIYNGQNDNENWGSFFYGLGFPSTAEIIDDIKLRINVVNAFPLRKAGVGIDPSSLFNKNWILIGSTSSRWSLRVDLAPTAAGIYGQVIYVDGEEYVAFVVARSIGKLLEQFAADLHNGLYFLDTGALDDGHHFIDTHPSIDLACWKTNDKWKHLAE